MSAQIDFDNISEEELAAMRGDNFEAEDSSESQPTPEVETEAEVDEPPASAEQEASEGTETATEDSGEGEASGDAVAEASQEANEEDNQDADDKEAAPTFMIPKSRYDAVMARLKEAEARNEANQQQQAPQTQTAPQEKSDPVASRMVEIDSEIAEAVKEADGDKVSKLMAESRELQAQLFKQQLNQTSSQTSAQAIEQVKYDNLVEQIEYLIPEVNPDGDVYDDGLVVEVQELSSAFMAQGHSSSDSLIRALNYIKPGWNEPDAETETESNAGTNDSGKTETKTEKAPEPKKTDVARNLADAKTTPPTMDEGTNSDTAGRSEKIDVMKLTDAEFEKLTEKELAALRGDDA